MHPLNINNWRDNDNNVEQLSEGCPIGYIYIYLLFTPCVGENIFLRWIWMKVEMTALTSQSRSNAYMGGVRK
jgi:hypothetical protein